jgi:tetratricopeptide (TPR) repeat protein
MRIPFKNLGQAELFLKTCSAHLDQLIQTVGTFRLPTQRVRNAFCRGYGYSSYDELKHELSTGGRDKRAIPSEKEFTEVFIKAFRLAIQVAEQACVGEDVGLQAMAPMLARDVVEELIITGSARELYEQGPREVAAERTDRGWALLEDGQLRGRLSAGLLDDAESEFSRAAAFDGDLADAYNGLAYVSLTRGDFNKAKRHSQIALEKARRALGSDEPGARVWYGDLETRPYMRARHNLGLSLMRLGDFTGAIREFKEMLRRNPNDNLGVRYLIGPLYHRIGKLRQALPAYKRVAAHGDLTGEPHNEINYALALYESEKLEEAVLRFRGGCLGNIHLPQVLLGLPSDRLNIWYGSNESEPEYAFEYVEEYGYLWEGKSAALAFLRGVYFHAAVQAELKEYVRLCALLATTHGYEGRAPIANDMTMLKSNWRLKDKNRLITEEVAADIRNNRTAR